MKFKSLKDLLKDNAFQNIKSSSYESNSRYGDDTFDFLTLIKNWHEIIGEKFAKLTIPLKIQYGTLTILCNHSAFAQHLGFLEEQIKLKIEARYPALKGKIKRINFQNNPRHFMQQVESYRKEEIVKEEPPEKQIHKYSPRYKELEKKAIELFKDLEEDETKTSLISIYIQSHYFED
ncbi:DUF721 domain-containing protein [Halobacteriovorax sp. GB3]|uniref:DUF721 domain-containing protein n=1 Tax=Halobacteriovorax sp. GB3 TaxID=2719615 RepID=UPI002362672C|nr:DUF721 domain-containing protein [Halobacteriovorax sp. GB3]MDD0853944.1 DUF721 domain-containing protein [Halobacteriovorax sp. GB3]